MVLETFWGMNNSAKPGVIQKLASESPDVQVPDGDVKCYGALDSLEG